MRGCIHRSAAERRGSRQSVPLPRQFDALYAAGSCIRLVLDYHSAHVSKETRVCLATTANRFEFVCTRLHDSWLNLMESFPAELPSTLLSGIQVESKVGLKQGIELDVDRLNDSSAVYKEACKMDEMSIVCLLIRYLGSSC